MKTLAISLFCTIFLSVAMMVMEPAYGEQRRIYSKGFGMDEEMACQMARTSASLKHSDARYASCDCRESSGNMWTCEVNYQTSE